MAIQQDKEAIRGQVSDPRSAFKRLRAGLSGFYCRATANGGGGNKACFAFTHFLKQLYIHLCSCGAEAPSALPGHCRAASSDRYHRGIVTGLYIVVSFCVLGTEKYKCFLLLLENQRVKASFLVLKFQNERILPATVQSRLSLLASRVAKALSLKTIQEISHQMTTIRLDSYVYSRSSFHEYCTRSTSRGKGAC